MYPFVRNLIVSLWLGYSVVFVAPIVVAWRDDFHHRLFKDGDVIIGAILPITSNVLCCHSNATTSCGDLLAESVLWAEAFRRAIELINRDDDLLGNLTLGYDIRDSCGSSQIAVKHALDFIDVIHFVASTEQEEQDDVPATVNFNRSIEEKRNLFKPTKRLIQNIHSRNNKIHPLHQTVASAVSGWTELFPANRTEWDCTEKPVAAIVGCLDSSLTTAVAALAQDVQMPVVGFWSTAVSLGDDVRYPTFVRTIPTDNIQAKAVVQTLLAFDWTYISIIGSENTYGIEGVEALTKEIEETGICVAVSELFDLSSPTLDEDVRRIIASVTTHPSARVVVLYMGTVAANIVLREAERQQVTGVIWFASDAWSEHPSLTKFNQSIVEGIVGLSLLKSGHETFRKYIANIDVICSMDHTWLYQLVCISGGCDQEVIRYYKECCSAYFRRSQKATCPLKLALKLTDHLDESLRYIQTGVLFDAVYAFAHGLNDLLTRNLTKNEAESFYDGVNSSAGTNATEWGRPSETSQIYLYSDLVTAIKHVSFINLHGEQVQFSDNGDPLRALYHVVNLQQDDCERGLVWRYIGRAKVQNGDVAVHIQHKKVKFHNGSRSVRSRCSDPCQPGTKKTQSPAECCWECTLCPEGFVSNTSEAKDCVKCVIIQHTDTNRTACLPDTLEWLHITDGIGIVILISSVLGQVITLTVISILGRHKNNPICSSLAFKTTSLLVCYAGFLQPIIYTVEPSAILCIFKKITWYSVFIVHGAIMVSRTFKVKFFVEKLKQKVNHKLHNVHHTVMWTFAIVGFVILGLSFLDSAPFKRYQKTAPDVSFVICAEKFLMADIAATVYPLFLLVITGLLAGTSKHSRSLDDKFLSYSSGAMLLMLVIFLPVYYTIEDGIGKVIILSVSVIITQYAVLCLTYFTKIYYMFRSYHKKETLRSAQALQRQNMAALQDGDSSSPNRSNGSIRTVTS